MMFYSRKGMAQPHSNTGRRGKGEGKGFMAIPGTLWGERFSSPDRDNLSIKKKMKAGSTRSSKRY